MPGQGMSRSNSAVLISLVLISIAVPLAFSLTTSANYAPAQGMYSYYRVSVTEVNSPGGLFPVNAGMVELDVVNATGTFAVNRSAAVHVTANVYNYFLTESGVKQYNGEVSVSVKGNTLTVTSNVPYLVEVVVNTSGMVYTAWAGLTNGSTTVKALAYVNGSAEVTLYFLNGTSMVPVKLTVKDGSSASQSVSLSLYSLVVSKVSVDTESKVIVVNEPRRYSPFFANFTANGTAYMNAEGFTVTKAYWNGTLLPALEWRSNGKVFHHTTVSFYGVNGTLVGYVTAYYLNLSVGSMGFSHRTEVSALIVVKVSNAYVKPHYHGSTYINGNKVEIFVGKNDTVMSTANVSFSHNVSVAGKGGVFVWVKVNSTAKAVFVDHDNETVNVTVVAPKSVNVTVVQYAGAYHRAEVVEVENVSGYMSFNVTVNGTVVAIIKTLPNGSKVALNSSSYFVANGKVYVLDDPTTTYTVVYNSTVQQSTSTTSTTQTSTTTSNSPMTTSTQTSTTTSSTSTSTSSQTSTTSQSSSAPPTTSSQVQVSPPPTSTTTNNTLTLAVVGVIVVLIVIGVAVAFMRRK